MYIECTYFGLDRKMVLSTSPQDQAQLDSQCLFLRHEFWPWHIYMNDGLSTSPQDQAPDSQCLFLRQSTAMTKDWESLFVELACYCHHHFHNIHKHHHNLIIFISISSSSNIILRQSTAMTTDWESLLLSWHVIVIIDIIISIPASLFNNFHLFVEGGMVFSSSLS